MTWKNVNNRTYFFSSGKVDSDDFSHKKWALACANAQNQTHYLSYKPKPTLRTPPRKGVPQRMNVALTQMPHTFAPHRANEDSATLRKIKKPALSNRLQILDGGMYETRTRDLRRDRPAL